MKNSIRKIVENFGTISFPYKTEINDWDSQITFTKINPMWDDKMEPYYFISPMGLKFNSLDEGINEFMELALTSKNKGLIQERLTKKGYDFENDYDIEKPNAELIKLFEDEGKLLDEEYNRTDKPITHKERINYIRDNEYFVGHPVNIKGVVIQAKSLEELVKKGKSLCRIHLEFMSEIIHQDEPFELVEQTDGMVWLHGEQEVKMRRELQKYKDTFGDI